MSKLCRQCWGGIRLSPDYRGSVGADLRVGPDLLSRYLSGSASNWKSRYMNLASRFFLTGPLPQPRPLIIAGLLYDRTIPPTPAPFRKIQIILF